MSGYTKLFASIVLSTIWRETNEVRILWVTMLAIADRDGVVEASMPGLADLARITIGQCMHALEKLSEPDPHSRTPDHEGRRIVAIQGGWRILNYEAYRERMSSDERKAKTAERVRRFRERQKLKAAGGNVTPDSGDVTKSNAGNYMQRQMQRQTQKQTQTPKGGKEGAPPPSPVERLDDQPGELHPDNVVAIYRAAVYPGKQWPIDTPSTEREAALRLIAAHPVERLRRLFEFVGGDRPRAGWRGWRAIAGTLAAFESMLPKIEAQALGGMDEPLTPGAALVHRELDAALQKRDGALALEAPTAAERQALNELVTKYGRDRVRVCIGTAMEHERLKKRVRDVDTFVGHIGDLISETAELWSEFTAKNRLHLLIPPVRDEQEASGV